MTSPQTVMFFKHRQEALDWMKEDIRIHQSGNETEPSPIDIITPLIAGTGMCDVRIDKHVENRRILSMTGGNPCVTDQHNFYYTVTITAAITMPVKTTRPQNKRKRLESTLLEKIKRVRRTKDIRQSDKEIDVFRLETIWMAESDVTDVPICVVCEKEKTLSAISIKKKRRGTNNEEETFIGIQNICSACVRQADFLQEKNLMSL